MSLKKYTPKAAKTAKAKKDMDLLYENMMQAARDNNINFIFAAYSKDHEINTSFGRGETDVLKGMLAKFKKRIKKE